MVARGNIQCPISTIAIGGSDIRVATNCTRFSRGTPLLVFNGLGINLETLFPLMRALGGVDAITLDVPGVGGSDAPLLPLTFSGLAQLSAQVLDHFAIETVVVMGVSWGAGIALAFASGLSGRCEKLIIASGTLGAAAIPGGIRSLVALSNPRRYIDSDYLRQHAGSLYGGKFSTSPALVEDYINTLHSHRSPTTYFNHLYASFCSPGVIGLYGIKQPTLIMAGSDDRMLSGANALLLHKLIPGSSLVTVDDGHMFFYSSPVETAGKIQQFMGGQI